MLKRLEKKKIWGEDNRMAKKRAFGKDIESSQQGQSISISQCQRSVPEKKAYICARHLRLSAIWTHFMVALKTLEFRYTIFWPIQTYIGHQRCK